MNEPSRNSGRAERVSRALAALAGACLVMLAGWLGLQRLGESLASLSYDMPFLIHRAGASDDLRIVYIDELDGASLDRTQQAALLDRLGQTGARAVVYDIMFDQPSKNPEVDRAFAAAMRRFRGLDEAGNPIPGQPRRHVFLACGRTLLQQTGAVGEQLIPPTDALLDAADDFGLVVFKHDESYIVRELIAGSPDEPAMTWKAAAALGAKLDEAGRLQPRWINYAGPPPSAQNPRAIPPFRSCTARNVLDGVDPGFFRDKIVLVGGKPGIVGVAAGLDLFATPFHRFDRGGNLPLMSGVELQANALTNFLGGNWLRRTSARFDLTLVLVAGLLAGAGFTRLPPLRGFYVALIAVFGLMLAGVLAVHYKHLWFPWSIVAFLQIPLALVWGVGAHFYIERFFRIRLGEEQRRLREAFARYLSPQMLDRLAAEGFTMRIGGDKVPAAMMFTDIEGFTDMCQKVRDPQRIVDTLNDYFERTTGHIFDHDGVVIKFIGDAIFAAWGAPLADPQAPVKAVRAAWRLFISARLLVDGDELRTRIGLHFGEVVAGNIGSPRHVDYTLIGDDVNLAARLESLNKLLGTSILLSDSIHPFLGDEFHTRRVGQFRVKGRQDITVVHELVGPAGGHPPPAWITTFHQALAALDRGDRHQAATLFRATIDARPAGGDGPSRFYLSLLAAEDPLPDGIVEMKEK